MKCNSCNIDIDPRFKAAIKKNECPGCAGSIMPPEKVAAMNSLRELLENNIVVKGVNTEALVSLIVANFEIKQLYREEKVEGLESKLDNEEVMEVEEVSPKSVKSDDGEDLAKLREEIYKDAERAQFGMETQLEYDDPEFDSGGADVDFDFGGGDGELFESEKVDPKTMAARLQAERDKAIRRAKMESGAGGFSRSE